MTGPLAVAGQLPAAVRWPAAAAAVALALTGLACWRRATRRQRDRRYPAAPQITYTDPPAGDLTGEERQHAAELCLAERTRLEYVAELRRRSR